MNKFYLITLWLLVLLYSCAYTNEVFESFRQTVKISTEYSLQSHSCNITKGSNANIHLVEFIKVSGGGTYFLGKRIKEGNGYKAKRLNVYKDELLVKSFSIMDFKNMNQDTINLLHYL